MIRPVLLGLALCGLAATAEIATGPNAGGRVPDFSLADQNSNQRTLASILGPKGALLVFYRSADW